MSKCKVCGFGEHSAASVEMVNIVWDSMKKDPEGFKDRRQTSIGTKTRCGLAACFDSCMSKSNSQGEVSKLIAAIENIAANWETGDLAASVREACEIAANLKGE